MSELTPTISSQASSEAESLYKGQKSIFIMIIGESGRGKSYSLRNLQPSSTYLVNVIGKILPFPSGLSYRLGQNMLITSESTTICRQMMEVSRQESFTNLIIDDAQYIMAMEFMAKALIKGYDKFNQMGQNFWNILTLAPKLRGGLKVFLLCHEEDTGTKRKMKTLGKMLDDKGTPEGLSAITLWSEVMISDGKRRYYFETQSDGLTNAKSPYGMFPPQIPNDLNLVSYRIDEYYQGVELENSKLNFNF